MQCGMRVIVLFVLANDKYNNSRHVHATMSVAVGGLMIISESTEAGLSTKGMASMASFFKPAAK
jgi:hypothetical protein